MNDKLYAVIEDTTYYDGDCQHPQGWRISIASIGSEDGEDYCIGSIEECQDWLDRIYDGHIYLNHGEAGKSYRIAEIIDDNADYQSWIDSITNWDGCPEGDDYDINTAWAESQAYNNNGHLYINHPQGYYGLIVDLEEPKNEN